MADMLQPHMCTSACSPMAATIKKCVLPHDSNITGLAAQQAHAYSLHRARLCLLPHRSTRGLQADASLIRWLTQDATAPLNFAIISLSQCYKVRQLRHKLSCLYPMQCQYRRCVGFPRGLSARSPGRPS